MVKNVRGQMFRKAITNGLLFGQMDEDRSSTVAFGEFKRGLLEQWAKFNRKVLKKIGDFGSTSNFSI